MAKRNTSTNTETNTATLATATAPEPSTATLATATAPEPSTATLVKAHAQWCTTTSTKRQYAHPNSAPVAWGKANTAKPGTARHAALAAMQAAVTAHGTWGAVYAVAATNWVHWAKSEGYLVPVV